jgi:hypothetical protein
MSAISFEILAWAPALVLRLDSAVTGALHNPHVKSSGKCNTEGRQDAPSAFLLRRWFGWRGDRCRAGRRRGRTGPPRLPRPCPSPSPSRCRCRSHAGLRCQPRVCRDPGHAGLVNRAALVQRQPLRQVPAREAHRPKDQRYRDNELRSYWSRTSALGTEMPPCLASSALTPTAAEPTGAAGGAPSGNMVSRHFRN